MNFLSSKMLDLLLSKDQDFGSIGNNARLPELYLRHVIKFWKGYQKTQILIKHKIWLTHQRAKEDESRLSKQKLLLGKANNLSYTYLPIPN